MQFKSFKSIVLLLLLATAQPVYPGFFDSIWSGIKGIGSWIQDNKKTSLLIASTVLGAGILYKYLTRKKTDSSKQQPYNDSIKPIVPYNPSVRSPLLNAFPCFNIERLHDLGDGFNKDGISNALWSKELFLSLDILQYLPPLQLQCIATFYHDQDIYETVFNYDSTRVLTRGKTAQLWDSNGKKLTTFRHNKPVGTATFNYDSTQVLTASSDTVRLWDINGNQLAVFQHDYFVSAVFNHDGTRVLTASDDDAVRLWDINGNQLALFQHDRVTLAVFNHDGTHILTASPYDNTVRLWDINGNQLALLQHDGWVESAVFNHDGTRILTVSSKNILDKVVKLWDINGNLLVTFRPDKKDLFRSVMFNGDNIYILMLSKGGTICLYDINGNKIALVQNNGWFDSAIFNRDCSRILMHKDKTAYLLDSSLLCKKFTPEQAAFIWLCREHYDKYNEKVLFRAIAKQFAKDGVTRDELIRVLQTFTSSEQQVLIKSFNILDAK